MQVRNIFTEMKSEIANVQAMIQSTLNDFVSEQRASGNDWADAPVVSCISTYLPSESIAKVDRLASLIGFKRSDMIMFLKVKTYDFKYYMSLVH